MREGKLAHAKAGDRQAAELACERRRIENRRRRGAAERIRRLDAHFRERERSCACSDVENKRNREWRHPRTVRKDAIATQRGRCDSHEIELIREGCR